MYKEANQKESNQENTGKKKLYIINTKQTQIDLYI